MTKILYFTAGPVATVSEKADIEALNKLVEAPYTVGVRNALASGAYGYGAENTDMIAGSAPLTGAGQAYENKPVFDPDTAAEGYAPITNGFVLTGVAPTGAYTNAVTFTVVDGAITAIVLS